MPAPLHPKFDPVTQTWFAPGLNGDFKSLADMQRSTKRPLIGYYPDGYQVRREETARDRQGHLSPSRTFFK